MSKERIEYKQAPTSLRAVALLIDVIICGILSLGMDAGWRLEYDLFWSKIITIDESLFPLLIIDWFIMVFIVYYVVSSSLTDGQTIGKMITGIRVVYEDNSSTKKAFKTHLKRLFFMRKGTKVVKEKDPEVVGL